MNWDHQAYSFGYPNAPPLTPNKTPTAATFPSPSPTVQTPQNNSNNFDIHSGWTPTFAEEYSVFNSTPGHILGTHRPILDVQGQEISNQQHPLAASEETYSSSNFQSQFQQPNSSPKLPLPPVEPSRRLSSSPVPPLNPPSNLPSNQTSGGIEKVKPKVTPRKTKGRLEETHSAQTATPPQTASRGVRRLAAKPTLAPSSMSQSQGYGQESMQHNGLPLLDFSNSSMEMYGYPMSAPATAAGYSQGKSFWDPDSSMTGMEMSFGNGNQSAIENSSHKQSNSYDWTRSNEMFQNAANSASFNMNTNRHSSISEAEIHPKNFNFNHNHLERHENSYEHGRRNRKEDEYASPTRTQVVDPGLLFSFPPTRNEFQHEQVSPDRGKAELPVRQPYQHQLRESMRDQEEELRRSRPSSQASYHSQNGRPAFTSPTRANPRTNLERSSSLKLQSQSQRSVDRNSRSRERRSSPIKNQNRTSLTSIPEAAKFRTKNELATRTDVTLKIDANGRARTETTIIVSSDQQARKRSASLANSGEWDGSASESSSSSDDEIIIVPSRNSSFRLPRDELPRSYSKRSRQAGRDPNNPQLRPDPIHPRSSSIYSQSSDPFHRRDPSHPDFESNHDPESEAETVVETLNSNENERSGDATSALRKVLEDRKKRSSRLDLSNITPTKTKRGGGRNTRFGGARANGSMWEGGTSAITTPSSNASGDLGDTPSTERSGVTRCVCGGFEGDGGGFMIQCDRCAKWLHTHCVGIDPSDVPHVYICSFCASTPSARGRLRDSGRGVRGDGGFASSPLTRKSFR